MKRPSASALVLCFILMLINVPAALAGPPFRTDDPETVEYQHWEFYVAHTYSNDKDGVSGTAPHFEANYGVIPNVQLHLLAPLAYDRPRGGPTLYGFGDVDLGHPRPESFFLLHSLSVDVGTAGEEKLRGICLVPRSLETLLFSKHLFEKVGGPCRGICPDILLLLPHHVKEPVKGLVGNMVVKIN
jgi:hypothetical protein